MNQELISKIKNNRILENWNGMVEIFNEKSNNPSVYFDIDGTLAYFYKDGKGLTYEEMFDPDNHYFRYLERHEYMILLAEELDKIGIDVCVISSSDYRSLKDKYDWLKENLPFLKDENIFFCPIGTDKTKFIKGNANISILIDDYNPNLEKWDKAGGLGIKTINSINSPNFKYKNLNTFQLEQIFKDDINALRQVICKEDIPLFQKLLNDLSLKNEKDIEIEMLL